MSDVKHDPDRGFNWIDDEDDYGGECYWCGGEGVDECRDPIQCTSYHRHYGSVAYCVCKECGGSGLAKDQMVW